MARHPWETTTSARRAPESATATPPPVATQSLSSSAFEPGLGAALARPAHQPHTRGVTLEGAEHAGEIEAVGIAQHEHELRPRHTGRHAREAAASPRASSQPSLTSTNGRERDPRQARGDHRERGLALELVLAR